MKRLIPYFPRVPSLRTWWRRAKECDRLFQGKGYFGVKVTADFENQPSNIDLVYSVSRGRRNRVETLAFRGNQHVDRSELMQRVTVEPHGHLLSRGKFSDKLVRESVQGITAFYKNRGYEEVKVDPDVVDHEPTIYIAFEIAEGPQTLNNLKSLNASC
jgi:outer membrane protein assembly factor BamA